MKRIYLALFTMAFALSFTGQDCGSGPLVTDPGFSLWRANGGLSAFQTTAGHIQKVTTWNDAEFGVEMLDDPTELVQFISPSSTTSCARVTVLAKVDPDARLMIRGGGNAIVVPPMDWGTYVDYMSVVGKDITPDAGDAIFVQRETRTALTIRKTGRGRVVLVKLNVEGTASCRPDDATPESQASAH
jgi:hypothetical protein